MIFGTRIAEHAGGRDNNFNLLRMLAASGVLVSHAYPIALGPGAEEPLEHWLNGLSLGMVCVMIFFAISGFFITRSFAYKSTLTSFVRARVLRLFPALAVVLVVTILAGAVITSVASGEYWPAAPTYFLRNITLFFLRFDLPGVFTTNPYGPPINGSLWTLNYEVMCYVGVVACGLLGLFQRPARFAAAVALFGIACWFVLTYEPHPRLVSLMRLGLPFVLGMCFWVWREQIRLSWLWAVGFIVLAVLLRPTLLFFPALTLAVAYSVFVLGYAQLPALLVYNRLGDYSYGTYIYAFPAQQLMAWYGFINPLTNMATALPLTLVCAVLSWHFVEAPALRLKTRGAAGRLAAG